MSIKNHVLHPLKMGWYNFQIKYLGAYRFFKKQQKVQEKRIIDKYYSISSENPVLVPCIIHTCNGFTWAGGLADRLKGIISLFAWCQKYNRPFKINFCEPFRLQDYLVPNQYDWLPDGVAYSGSNVLPRICLREPRTDRYLNSRWDELFPRWMEGYVGDERKQYHVYTNMFLSNFNFSDNFNKLFKPCDRLQTEINHHLGLIGGQYISISFRFTTLLGDFTDCTGKPLSDVEKKKLIQDSLNAIKSISASAPKHDKILVTADSCTFTERVKNMENVYVIPGKIGHIDYDHGDDVNMKTFLDFFMISKAEAVFLAKGTGMYNSAFAKTAAMVNDKTFTVYEY